MTDAYSFQDYLINTHRLMDQVEPAEVRAVCDALEAAYRAGGTVYACGNGGSAATASHFIEDLAKLMYDERGGRRLKALSLTDASAFMTALANDDGYDRIFEIQLAIQASPGDVLLCISGSGQSPNVLKAAKWANSHGVRTVAITGFDGGELQRVASVKLHVPSYNMGMLECVHMLVLDFISKELRHRAYGTAHQER
jgi:D-sedoheptulose 7-phosphate isomerase